MLKIRLQRIGRRNQPFYRVVVTDSKFGPKSGRFLEVLGSYNPKAGDIQIDEASAKEWIAKGAKVSGTVHNFLVDKGVIKGKKLNVLPKKSPTKKRNAPDEPEPQAAPTEAPAADAVTETPAGEAAAPTEAPAEETPAVEEKKEEAPAEEPKEEPKTEETPAEEAPTDTPEEKEA